jgi:hypothetical protein
MSTTVETIDGTTHLSIDYHPSSEAKAFIEDPTYATAFFGPL